MHQLQTRPYCGPCSRSLEMHLAVHRCRVRAAEGPHSVQQSLLASPDPARQLREQQLCSKHSMHARCSGIPAGEPFSHTWQSRDARVCAVQRPRGIQQQLCCKQ